jgi:hypothetical protein
MFSAAVEFSRPRGDADLQRNVGRLNVMRMVTAPKSNSFMVAQTGAHALSEIRKSARWLLFHGRFSLDVLAWLVLLIPLGCHSTGPRAIPRGPEFSGVAGLPADCFGYYGTCWSRWPAQCLPCPPPMLSEKTGELLPSVAPNNSPPPAVPSNGASPEPSVR